MTTSAMNRFAYSEYNKAHRLVDSLVWFALAGSGLWIMLLGWGLLTS